MDIYERMKAYIKPDIERRWGVKPHEVVKNSPSGRARYEDWLRTMYWM